MGVRSENRWSRLLRTEGDRAYMDIHQREAACMPRKQRVPVTSTDCVVTPRHVRSWMRRNNDYETATELAQSAIAEFDLPDDETHWVWDIAVLVMDEK